MSSLAMSSRARLDQLSFTFLNGNAGLRLAENYKLDTPELQQFWSFVTSTDKIQLGKQGMAPMFASSFGGDLQDRYTAIREKVVRLNRTKLEKDQINDLRKDITKMIELLNSLSLVAEKSLYR
jgi:hypothetical protein